MENDRYTRMPGVKYGSCHVPARSNRTDYMDQERTQALINALGLTESNGSTLNTGSSGVNPILHHYISPIGVSMSTPLLVLGVELTSPVQTWLTLLLLNQETDMLKAWYRLPSIPGRGYIVGAV